MSGRYGVYGQDTLGKVMMWVYLGWILTCSVVEIFVDNIWFSLGYWLITLLMVFYMFFRIFSKNIVARRRENERFCGFFKLRRNKFRDRKTHIYRKCPKCKVVLRLPKAKGKHMVVCPKCRERFEVKSR